MYNVVPYHTRNVLAVRHALPSFNSQEEFSVRVFHSTFTWTLPVSAAFGTVTVSTPSESLAVTLLLSTGCGSTTVRVKLDVPENIRSVEMAVCSGFCGAVTANASSALCSRSDRAYTCTYLQWMMMMR